MSRRAGELSRSSIRPTQFRPIDYLGSPSGRLSRGHISHPSDFLEGLRSIPTAASSTSIWLPAAFENAAGLLHLMDELRGASSQANQTRVPRRRDSRLDSSRQSVHK